MDKVVYYGGNLCCRTLLRRDIFYLGYAFIRFGLIHRWWEKACCSFHFILAAAQRSRNIQLRKMLQKYFINNMPQEFLAGGIQLKKIRVQKDRLVVYYKKISGR